MNRIRLAALAFVGISALAASTAFATGINRPCTLANVAGSYIRQQGEFFIDQMIFSRDGTVYWNQSTQFDHPITAGTTLESIGTWKCTDATTLVMTTISTIYRSEGVPDPFQIGDLVPDLVPDLWERETLRFHVVNKNTLEKNYTVFRQFALTDDPLSPTATPINTLTSANVSTFTRVRVLTSDIP